MGEDSPQSSGKVEKLVFGWKKIILHMKKYLDSYLLGDIFQVFKDYFSFFLEEMHEIMLQNNRKNVVEFWPVAVEFFFWI